jgi:hypothetical protein
MGVILLDLQLHEKCTFLARGFAHIIFKRCPRENNIVVAHTLASRVGPQSCVWLEDPPDFIVGLLADDVNISSNWGLDTRLKMEKGFPFGKTGGWERPPLPPGSLGCSTFAPIKTFLLPLLCLSPHLRCSLDAPLALMIELCGPRW